MLCQEILERESEIVKKFENELSQFEQFIAKTRLELTYLATCSSAEQFDSKTQIQCVAYEIKNFLEQRKFYELNQAVEDFVYKIKEHLSKYSSLDLQQDVFSSVIEAIQIHRKSIDNMFKYWKKFVELACSDNNILKNDNEVDDLTLCLDNFAYEFKDNFLFFSTSMINAIEEICQTFLSILSNKAKNTSSKKLEASLRSIIDILDKEEQASAEEDESIFLTFRLLNAQPTTSSD
jgi:hypothetical protein